MPSQQFQCHAMPNLSKAYEQSFLFILCSFLSQNVLDLYHVAEKIVGINIDNILDKSKSECEDTRDAT